MKAPRTGHPRPCQRPYSTILASLGTVAPALYASHVAPHAVHLQTSLTFTRFPPRGSHDLPILWCLSPICLFSVNPSPVPYACLWSHYQILGWLLCAPFSNRIFHNIQHILQKNQQILEQDNPSNHLNMKVPLQVHECAYYEEVMVGFKTFFAPK